MKTGMQMMVESMLPPGFLDKLQTEFLPFVSNLDGRLQAMQQAQERLDSKLDQLIAAVDRVQSKVDPSFTDQFPPTLQNLLSNSADTSKLEN